MMESIGIREFKDRLGFYLRAVRKGETITITKWGKPIARLIPVPLPDKIGLSRELEERMWELVAEGTIAWNGGPFELPEPVAVNQTPTLLSDLVVADRE
jgi:prevent-host-death family protein